MEVQVESIAASLIKYNEPHTAKSAETETSSASPPLQDHDIPGTSPKEENSTELPATEAPNTPPSEPTDQQKTPPRNTTSKSGKKRKALVALYQSELSPSQGIKICIKKSDTTTTLDISKKRKAKRPRKQKNRDLEDSDDSEYEKKRRKDKSNNNNTIKESTDEVKEQSNWGSTIPEEVLCKIFSYVIESEGPLPTLCRLARVCSLWNRVSLIQSLWSSVDLGTAIKEKFRTELKLKWFIDNRISQCTDLNVANWKVSDVTCVLAKIAYGCKNLKSLTLTGWKGFSSENFKFISEEMPNLSSLDISAINVEMNTSKSAIGLQSLCDAIKTMNGRLTHLHLAHNRLAGMPQIIEALANHCPNLVQLDLSNVRTVAHSHGIIHIEKLQAGCQKLKVLRLTNSYVNLSTSTLQEQMESPGFPDLEELSVAVIGDGRIINDEFLQRILKTSSKLKLLDIRGCARLTHESLIRCPAWDLRHLFLSGCQEMTRDIGSGLELIASKWSHSLIELDLAWANVQKPVDNALKALAEKGVECPISHLNLCGSSVSVEAVREVLIKCPNIKSINLSSCRGLPRGVKRLMSGATELQELREAINISDNDN